MSQIAFVFPGQGSQSVHMLRDLTLALPGVRETVSAVVTEMLPRN